jgi:hypothetical protein
MMLGVEVRSGRWLVLSSQRVWERASFKWISLSWRALRSQPCWIPISIHIATSYLFGIEFEML